MTLTQTQQFYEILNKAKNPLITFKKDANGDTITSSLALAKLFNKLNKPVEIVATDFVMPENYKFLNTSQIIQDNLSNHKQFAISFDITNAQNPNVEHIIENNQLHIYITPEKGQLNKSCVQINDLKYKHDLIITLNTPDLEMLDSIYHENPDLFFSTPIINIDHETDNEHYGQINFVDLKATSVAEIIYDIFTELDANFLDDKIATYLLTGMIAKTNSFKMPNVTPKTLDIASHLITLGAQRDLIIKNLFQTKTIDTLKLWGRLLLKLRTDENQKLAWTFVSSQDFSQTKTNSSHLCGVVDELIVNIPTIEVTTIFYEEKQQRYCLIKTEKNINLQNHFKLLNPQTINKSLIRIKLNQNNQEILEKLQSLI